MSLTANFCRKRGCEAMVLQVLPGIQVEKPPG